MFDVHCHVSAYPDPGRIARESCERHILTVAVTGTPSEFRAWRLRLQEYSYVRIALGLHPSRPNKSFSDLLAFERLLTLTSYVGEVGLDFSSADDHERARQVKDLEWVFATVKPLKKMLSVHCRKADSAMCDLFDKDGPKNVAMHWYSGSIRSLDRFCEHGCFFSVNPHMIRTPSGLRIVDRIPPDRVLTESDGPYVQVHGRECRPSDIALVIGHLARSWNVSVEEAEQRLANNLATLMAR